MIKFVILSLLFKKKNLIHLARFKIFSTNNSNTSSHHGKGPNNPLFGSLECIFTISENLSFRSVQIDDDEISDECKHKIRSEKFVCST
jgi:hypothetical protein